MPPEETPQNQPDLKTIRTYQSDVEDALKGGGGSLAKIAIAENDRRTRQPITLTEESDGPNQTKIIVGVSIGLVILGIIIFTFIYFWSGGKNAPAPTTAQVAPIIITDTDRNISIAGLQRDGIIAALKNEKATDKITLSSVAGLRLTDNGTGTAQITALNFLGKLQSHAPDEFIRSLQDNFLFGLHALNVNQPFLILKTDYYQSAFAGMISWENNLVDDLGPLFITSAAATSTDQSLVLPKSNVLFEDLTIKNRDARVLRDDTGKIIFLYAFPDKSTIVITTNADTLDAIDTRLLTSKLVR